MLVFLKRLISKGNGDHIFFYIDVVLEFHMRTKHKVNILNVEGKKKISTVYVVLYDSEKCGIS